MTSLSKIAYLGDGGTGPFSAPFPFLDPSHVYVSVDGVDVGFSWSGDAVLLDVAAPSGSVVEIRRETPVEARLVDFTDGSVLTEADLDLALLQQLYIAQEVVDQVDGLLGRDPLGVFDAGGARLGGLGDPSAAQDAVTKAYVDGLSGVTASTEAAVSAADAEAAQTAAEAAQAAAEAAAASVGSGVPNGGAAGQVLKKSSNADGDADWADDLAAPSIADGQILANTSGQIATASGHDAAAIRALLEVYAAGETDAAIGAALDAFPLAEAFTSAQQTIASGGALTIPHNLSMTPDRWDVFIICVGAEHGYGVGDVIQIGAAHAQIGANQGRGVAVQADATNLHVRYGNNAAVFFQLNFDTGAYQNLTNSNWRMVIKAYSGGAAAQGPVGPAGADGNAVLHGASDPSAEGVDGDFYLNTATKTLFGPKTLGIWPAGAGLIGPAGADGADGADGNTVLYGASDPSTEGVDGNFYLNTATNTLFGPRTSGSWPARAPPPARAAASPSAAEACAAGDRIRSSAATPIAAAPSTSIRGRSSRPAIGVCDSTPILPTKLMKASSRCSARPRPSASSPVTISGRSRSEGSGGSAPSRALWWISRATRGFCSSSASTL